MARQIGHREVYAEGLVGLGDVMLATGDLAAARTAWQEALPILDDLQSPSSVTADAVRTRLGRVW